jgi:hypothetical protein
MPQEFILQPGTWIGEGKITFSASPDFIKFYTKWQIAQTQPGQLLAVQTVEMQNVEDHVINYFTLTDIKEASFSIAVESATIGKVDGTGLIAERTIAWEFRGNPSFEGFEVYERQENGDYSFHAEYASTDQFRTLVDGLIWKKGEQ